MYSRVLIHGQIFHGFLARVLGTEHTVYTHTGRRKYSVLGRRNKVLQFYRDAEKSMYEKFHVSKIPYVLTRKYNVKYIRPKEKTAQMMKHNKH